MPLSRTVARARAKHAVTVRHHGDAAPVTVEALRDLEAARVEDRVTRAVLELVDQAPKLSPEQRDRLAVLLRGGAVA